MDNKITAEIKELTKTFNPKGKFPVKALDNVSFTIDKNEIIGLIGPNGAGKTTLMRAMLGFIKYDSGSIDIFGHKAGSVEAKKHLAFQADTQFKSKVFKVYDFLKFHSEMMGLKNNEEQISEYLQFFNMKQQAEKPLSSLSKGMRQKIEIIQAFLGNTNLILLDEPTAALDPPSVFELRDFLKNENEKGRAVLFSSHNLTEVEKVCHRVLFINEGILAGDYTISETDSGFLETAFKNYETNRKFI